MKRTFAVLLVLFLMALPVMAQSPARAAGHAKTTGATITTGAPPAGEFVYITGIDISNCAGASAVTAAAPTYVTTTNITGAPQFQVGSGVTAGLCQPSSYSFAGGGLRATAAATAVTVVLPAFATNQTVSVNVYFYFGPAF